MLHQFTKWLGVFVALVLLLVMVLFAALRAAA